jgi:hypothetical protein
VSDVLHFSNACTYVNSPDRLREACRSSTHSSTPFPSLFCTLHSLPDMDGVRVDTWVETGTEISPYYDSMLAKLMVYAPTREAAVTKMKEAIAATRLKGVPNNLEFLGELVKDPRFEAGGWQRGSGKGSTRSWAKAGGLSGGRGRQTKRRVSLSRSMLRALHTVPRIIYVAVLNV